MRVWVDFTNSPHVLVLRPVIEQLQREGHDVDVTARDFAQTLGLCERFGIEYTLAGPDVLLHYEMGGLNRKAPFAGVWGRQGEGGGLVLGSVGCFLVIESRAHAASRGAVPVARIAGVATDRCRRQPGQARANAERQLAEFAAGKLLNGSTPSSGHGPE